MDCCSICSLHFSYHETTLWKRVPFCAGRGQLLGKRGGKKIIWQMAWTIPFLLTFAVIPVFPVLAQCTCTMVLMLLWGYKGGINSGVLSLSFPPFFWAILCAASRRASGEGVLCSGYSRLLTWTSCVVAAKVLICLESWNGLGWTFKDHLVQPPPPPPPRTGTSSSRSGSSRPRPTWLWTLRTAPRLL